MPRIKTFLCSGICLFFITVLTAQVIPAKNSNNIGNVASDHFYEGKHWSLKQLLKDSVLCQYKTPYDHSDGHWEISRLSTIYISFIEQPLAPHLSVSEKIESHLEANLFYRDKHYPTKCFWLPQKYRRPIVDKFFFNYQ
jgi:hypothetical protein